MIITYAADRLGWLPRRTNNASIGKLFNGLCVMLGAWCQSTMAALAQPTTLAISYGASAKVKSKMATENSEA